MNTPIGAVFGIQLIIIDFDDSSSMTDNLTGICHHNN
jgi:hypothetical protein